MSHCHHDNQEDALYIERLSTYETDPTDDYDKRHERLRTVRNGCCARIPELQLEIQHDQNLTLALQERIESRKPLAYQINFGERLF